MIRPTGRPDSATARSMSVSPSASMLSAMASRKSARASDVVER
ncbi:hypothetical protein QE397_000532 [Rhodococcus sp. SORGH_AS 301]|nr:hypothetical protein [Rhodococcus sp. SORGH_AS_0301]